MKKGLYLFIALLFVFSAVPFGDASSSAHAADGIALMVADFNSGGKPNNLGGDFGSWDKDPGDTTQKCTNYFDGDNFYGDYGFGLAIEYDVDSPNAAYNGFWMKLEGADASSYDNLRFWIKGDAAAGFTPKVKLELKNESGEVGKYMLENIGPSWKEVSIPFAEFRGLKDRTRMKEFVIVFDDENSMPKVGKIYIDDIAFAN